MKVTKRSPTSSSTSIKKQSHIPRPKNSFMIYRQEKQYEAAKHIEGNNNKDISKLVGKWWNNETEEVKNKYRKLADEAKKLHLKLYPNYRYCPKKSVKSGNGQQQQQQQPVLTSNVTRHHYQEYTQFPYHSLPQHYVNTETLTDIPPCTCCETNLQTQNYNLPPLPIPEAIETNQYFHNLDLSNSAANHHHNQYEQNPSNQAFYNEYNLNYLTPITQSPASLNSGTFTNPSDNSHLAFIGNCYSNESQFNNEYNPNYPTLYNGNQYDYVGINDHGINPSVFYSPSL